MSDVVKGLRFTSGEEVIAFFNENTHTLTDPMMLVPAGEGRIALIPWCFYTDDDITVNPDTIIYTVTPSRELENEYRKRVNSIVLPDTGIVDVIGAD